MQPRLNKRWVIHERISAEVEQELAAYPPFFRQILYARGVRSAAQAQAYLTCALPFAAGPFDLSGMDAAVDCILAALDRDVPIAVYGDYDVDGVTATALLTQVLRGFGAQVTPYIPNRFDEGYGLNVEALDRLAADGIRLVVTVDCGIRSPVEARRARELGIDLVISDHHQPAAELPQANAVICPKQEGDNYPDKDLSGAGLAYKIAQALVMRRPDCGVRAEDFLDLVALGTVADVVPLVGENRVLVRRGLDLMRIKIFEMRPGFFALASVAGLKLTRISATDVAFMLGPRLNAAGRLETAQKSLNLLLTADRMESGLLAQELDNQNRQRQDLTRKTQEDAIRRAAEEASEDILFAFDESYNPGIVGLAASRLVETFYRPAIVGQVEKEFTRASCRSIPEFHITRALDSCRDLLERHGGHALAAGFTVRNENRPELVRRLREIAAQELGGRDLYASLRADMEIPLYDLRPDFLEHLERLQPAGQGNPEAAFVSRNVPVRKYSTMGGEKQHLRMTLDAGYGYVIDAVAFRQGHKAAQMPKHIDLLYSYETNEYNGRTSLQLNVRDFKPAGEPD
jgi:single-stranded-DNA-specific exonuclease